MLRMTSSAPVAGVASALLLKAVFQGVFETNVRVTVIQSHMIEWPDCCDIGALGVFAVSC